LQIYNATKMELVTQSVESKSESVKARCDDSLDGGAFWLPIGTQGRVEQVDRLLGVESLI
jgi:hypothetical protein